MSLTLSHYLSIPKAWRPPLMVADGMGVDSLAMLIHLKRSGIRPDAILHADTGDENAETVTYREERRRWLAEVGFPELTIVKRAPSKPGLRRDGTRGESYDTLSGNCLANATLPSLAFGRKACSVKWKVEPQNAWTDRWAPAIHAWASGRRVFKCIGYDAGPKDSRRAHDMKGDHEYAYLYPLRDLGWEREQCVAEILAEGLPLPRKSACKMCPANQPHEVAHLVQFHPSDADLLVQIEAAAAPNLRGVEGLWRSTVKGVRGGVARPGSMTKFITELRADPAMLKRHLRLVDEAGRPLAAAVAAGLCS